MRALSKGLGALAATVILTCQQPAWGDIASALIREADVIPGASTVEGISAPASNGVGGYAFGTTHADNLSRFFGSATWGAATLLRTEGTFGPYTQTGIESFHGFSDSGSIGYSPTVNIGASTGLDAAWVDDTSVLVEEQAMPSLPGQFSTFNSDVQMMYDGTPYWVGGWSSSAGGSTQNRGLIKGMAASVVIQGGDLIPSAGAPIDPADGPGFGSRFSAYGANFIIAPGLGAPATSGNDTGIVVNGDLLNAGGGLVREGTAVAPAAGGIGDNWSSFDAMAINEAGDAFFTGDTTAATSMDEFVFVGDSIVLREGTALATPLGAGVLSGDIEWGDANEQNDWAVTWDVTVGGSNLEALVINGAVALVESQLVDWNGDGVVDLGDNNARLADFTGLRAVAVGEPQISGSTQFFDVFFTADIDFNGTSSSTDDLEGAFHYRVSTVIPEPSSAALAVAAGLLAAFAVRKRVKS